MANEPLVHDPVARAAEKQASRQRDADDLAAGRKSVADLRRENGAFAFPHVRIDFDAIDGARPIRVVETDPAGGLTVRTRKSAYGFQSVGRSRPVFTIDAPGTDTHGWCVDLANEDDGWGFATHGEAVHFVGVLQAVMDLHLEAAREEGRREERAACLTIAEDEVASHERGDDRAWSAADRIASAIRARTEGAPPRG